MSENPPRTNPSKLAGKVAIVTGGASGIGEATARLFADHRARAVIIADINKTLGEQVAESIGAQAQFVHCDVTHEDQVRDLVNTTLRAQGTLDIMFSNAGIVSPLEQTVLGLDLSFLDQLFAVNVRGMAACVKHAAQAMVDRGVRGSIVCTGSVASMCGGVKRTDYHMSKHAVLGLVRSASVQLGPKGIRVNCVSPYALASGLTRRALGMDAADDVEKVYGPHMLLKEKPLKASHVADAVLFLASDDSELITGHNLVVDGGFLIRSTA
ncbi:(-)-isopiperitenol/(-)-carveol dehydrogenase, mitochondrial-like [Punica granatum]|nr:(-)-isopiperitenol/(-)-carveol dehydrogenase, mitochondrial-like [Punica granatum]OWM90440.1 hypothetical protein CDL15_Pgr014743 [Punica granatum]